MAQNLQSRQSSLKLGKSLNAQPWPQTHANPSQVLVRSRKCRVLCCKLDDSELVCSRSLLLPAGCRVLENDPK